MATNDDILHTQRVETRSIETHSYLSSLKHVSWQAILAGVAITLAVQILLSLLGTAIGMSTIDPLEGESPSAQAFSLGAALWWAVSFFLSLAIGGMVAAEMSGFSDRMDGVLHGLVTWATAMLVGVYLVGQLVGSTLSGIGGLASSTIKGAAHGAAVASIDAGDANGTDKTTLNWGEIETEIQGLLAQGANNPAQQNSDRSAATTPDLIQQVQTFLENDQVTPEQRQELVALIARTGNMSEQEAAQKLDAWEKAYRDANATLNRAAGEVNQKAAVIGEKGANALAHVSFWSFITFLLGALAAALGGMAGSKCREERILRHRTVV